MGQSCRARCEVAAGRGEPLERLKEEEEGASEENFLSNFVLILKHFQDSKVQKQELNDIHTSEQAAGEFDNFLSKPSNLQERQLA